MLEGILVFVWLAIAVFTVLYIRSLPSAVPPTPPSTETTVSYVRTDEFGMSKPALLTENSNYIPTSVKNPFSPSKVVRLRIVGWATGIQGQFTQTYMKFPSEYFGGLTQVLVNGLIASFETDPFNQSVLIRFPMGQPPVCEDKESSCEFILDLFSSLDITIPTDMRLLGSLGTSTPT